MNKKKICSIMLSFVMTMSVLCSFHGTVMADPVDPQQPDAVASEEQEPPKQDEQEPEKKQDPEQNQEPEKQPEQDPQQQEPAPQQPENDPQQPGQEPQDDNSQQDAGPKRGAGTRGLPFDNYPDAYFAIRKPDQITHGGYADIKCEFDSNGIVFGKVGENGQPQQLELNISRTAKIYNKNGDEVCTVEVTNDKYNLSTGSELKFTRSMGDNSPFTFAVNIPASTYIDLDAGGYTLAVEYQATWQNVIDLSTFQRIDDITLPTGTIAIALGKFADAEFGSFGKGLSWEFSYYGGRLTIFGNGAMPDYDAENLSHRPWDHLIDKVKSIYITQDITAIGKNAFSGFTSAETLTFNDYTVVKTIGDRAFAGCGFTSLSIPSTVTSIGEAAFQNCNKISGELTIPSSVTSLGDAAFGFCGFSRVNIWTELTSIGKNTFVNCSNLEYVYMYNTVKTIGDSAFEGCSKLDDLHLSENLTSIGRGAFARTGVKEISIPDGVTKIPYQAFYGCSDLTKITIPGSVTTIEDSAFSGCSKLETITLPPSVTSISGGSFSGCDKLASVYCQADPDKLTWGASSSDFISNKGTKCYVASRFITKFESKFGSINVDFEANTYASGTCGENVNWTLDGDGTLFITGTGPMEDYTGSWGGGAPWYDNYKDTITSVVIGDGVTTVGSYAFYKCINLTSVSLPDSIKIIKRRAFSETHSLASIELPANLETIGTEAFCVSMIRSITIPDSVKTIEDYAFQSTYKMTSVTIGKNVETIGRLSFENSTIESVVIPSSVKSIGFQAFCNTSNLTSVTLSDGLESIGAEAFMSCSSLESITIPGSVQIMGTDIFRYCDSLTTATISEGVTCIPEGMFRDCNHLKNVTISDTVTSIGEDAFHVDYYNQPDSIESIVIPNSVNSIASGAFYGQSLRSITIPGSVTTISSGAFRNCDQLETVTILNGVTTIENNAFEYSDNIKSVTVPSSVTSLGDHAFGPGQNLKNIYSYTEPSVWISYSYGTAYTEDTKLHVPADKVDSYRQTLNPYSTLISEANLIGDANGEGTINTGVGVHLYGYNLSLRDYIGVNFWFKLDEGYTAGDNYVLFTVNSKTQKVKVSQASDGTDGAMIFPCGVVAKEMTDVITAQFYLADGTAVGSAYTYTVRDYANYILTHQSSYSNNAVKLVKSILNYGSATQTYFNYKTNSLANSGLDAADQIVNILSAGDIICKEVSSGYVTPAQLSLVLKDTISLKLYFHKADVQDLVITSNRDITVTESGDFIIVRFDGITPSEFVSAVGVDFYDANNQFLGQTLYSPAKYCQLVLNQPTNEIYTDDLKRVVSALYKYSEATVDYMQYPNR